MLKYVKINSNKFEFKLGVNIITCIVDNKVEDNNNIGKTSLIKIIKGIYGNKNQLLENDMIQKMKSNNIPGRIEWCFYINESSIKYFYDIEVPNFIYNNYDKEFTLTEYRIEVMRLLGSEVEVLGKTFNSNLNFIKSSEDSNTFRQILDKESDTYNTFFALKLLLGSDFDKYSDLEKYFSLVGHNENMKKSRNAIRKEISRNSESEDVSEQLEMLHKMRTNRNKLIKMKDSEVDYSIINQIKEVLPEIDIDSIIHFQTQLYEDYNYLITEELEDLDSKIKTIEQIIGDHSTEKIAKSDYKLLDAVKENIEYVEEELTVQTIRLSEMRNELYDLGNKFLDEVETQFGQLISLNHTDNCFRDGTGRKILKNTKFQIGLKHHSGSGHKLVNLTLIFALFLRRTKIDICVLDTSQDSEISVLNFNKLINLISGMNLSKQMIFITFKTEIEDPSNIVFNLSDSTPLFGVRF